MSTFLRHVPEVGEKYYLTQEEADAVCKVLGIENRNICTIITQPHNGDVRDIVRMNYDLEAEDAN